MICTTYQLPGALQQRMNGIVPDRTICLEGGCRMGNVLIAQTSCVLMAAVTVLLLFVRPDHTPGTLYKYAVRTPPGMVSRCLNTVLFDIRMKELIKNPFIGHVVCNKNLKTLQDRMIGMVILVVLMIGSIIRLLESLFVVVLS